MVYNGYLLSIMFYTGYLLSIMFYAGHLLSNVQDWFSVVYNVIH